MRLLISTLPFLLPALLTAATVFGAVQISASQWDPLDSDPYSVTATVDDSVPRTEINGGNIGLVTVDDEGVQFGPELMELPTTVEPTDTEMTLWVSEKPSSKQLDDGLYLHLFEGNASHSLSMHVFLTVLASLIPVAAVGALGAFAGAAARDNLEDLVPDTSRRTRRKQARHADLKFTFGPDVGADQIGKENRRLPALAEQRDRIGPNRRVQLNAELRTLRSRMLELWRQLDGQWRSGNVDDDVMVDVTRHVADWLQLAAELSDTHADRIVARGLLLADALDDVVDAERELRFAQLSRFGSSLELVDISQRWRAVVAAYDELDALDPTTRTAATAGPATSTPT